LLSPEDKSTGNKKPACVSDTGRFQIKAGCRDLLYGVKHEIDGSHHGIIRTGHAKPLGRHCIIVETVNGIFVKRLNAFLNTWLPGCSITQDG